MKRRSGLPSSDQEEFEAKLLHCIAPVDAPLAAIPHLPDRLHQEFGLTAIPDGGALHGQAAGEEVPVFRGLSEATADRDREGQGPVQVVRGDGKDGIGKRLDTSANLSDCWVGA